MGIPLFKFAAEQTGGNLTIKSKHIDDFPEDHGTSVSAVFYTDHIDCPPIGDVVSTVVTLIHGHPDVETVFTHKLKNEKVISLDTREMRAVLGEVPLNTFEVLEWIRGTLEEQYVDFQ